MKLNKFSKLNWNYVHVNNEKFNSSDEQSELVCRDFFESFIWSSMDHSKNNFRNNYLIFKSTYFISFLITTSFSY